MSQSPLPLIPCLLAGFAAPAQPNPTGQILGQVMDRQGAPMAGVAVQVRHLPTGETRTVTTAGDGSFRMGLLPYGPYEVTLTRSGYSTLKASVTVGASATPLQVRMHPEAQACVEVVGMSASVDATSLTTSRSLSQMNCMAPGIAGGQARASERSIRRPSAPANTETYRKVEENPFKSVRQDPLSTFSIDVDTASYSHVRRFIDSQRMPPKDAVRIEELMNYFAYSYPEPTADRPFSVSTEVFECPWAPKHHLVRVGLQAQRLDLKALPPRNLVFLIDVSGSMSDEHRLPLVKQGLIRLCDSLRPEDHVALVVYAGSSGLVLEPTSGAHKERIQEALGRLEAGGSTHGSAGLRQAYEVAKQHFRKGADNRVLLCTDGDFNVGETDEGTLVRLIESERRSGVFLTCLGFGMGNLRDATLEQLADKGNGNYAYIDSLKEMEKVFGAGGASLVTVAKDVKLQIEFNPAQAKAYRLVGYENRLLEAADFNDDAKDAGEMNVGHSVTALYEVVPPEEPMALPSVDPLKYQGAPRPRASRSADLLTVKVRYKRPDAFFSTRLEVPVQREVRPLSEASADSRWAAAVAAFGMVLRDSPDKGSASLDLASRLAQGALGPDPAGLRAEFLRLLGTAEGLIKASGPGAL